MLLDFDDDPLVLRQLADRASTELARIRLLNRVLYVAHTTYGKSIEELAQQTGRTVSDIRDRIAYVGQRMARILLEDSGDK